VNSSPLAPDAHAAPAALPRPLKQRVEELARLLDAPQTPAVFYEAFLQSVQAALGGVAAAVWGRVHDQFNVEHQLHLAEVGLDRTLPTRACHEEILRRVVKRERPVWVPPSTDAAPADDAVVPKNLTAHGILLVPILQGGEAAGVLEVWLRPGLDADTREMGAHFLTLAAGVAAAFLHKTRWLQLQGRQQRWDQCEALSRQLHGSLDPREIAYLAANQGRLLIDCDQVSIGLRRGAKLQVEAISGTPLLETRSPLVQAIRTLLDTVLTWGEKVAYTGTRDEGLPPAVLAALDAYLSLGNSRVLLLLPLRDEREEAASGSAVLMVESFAPTTSIEQMEGRVQALAQPTAAALYNALAYQRARAGWLTKSYGALRDWSLGKRGRTLTLVVCALVVLLGALAIIPAPLRLDARGQLLPKERQIVYATHSGKIIELKTHHGDSVQKGQELLFLEDLEAHLKVEQLAIKVAFAEQRLAALADQLGKAGSNEDRNALVKERSNQEYELRKAAVERDILLQESRSPRKAPLAAPLSGKLVTFDAREQLLGKTVKPGEPLVRIARVQGPWEIELNLPESALAPIREGLRRAPDGALEVHLLLASQPLRTYQGRLRWDGLGGETTVKDNAVVLPTRIEIVDPALREQLASLPVGLEVRAKIYCGQRPVGEVWFGDLLEFFYERLLF
jgi:multidrug efflux pump subunit AcrA (membrane-fusion protein)